MIVINGVISPKDRVKMVKSPEGKPIYVRPFLNAP